MDMIAVDPKLFITCRLCLEEMGQYQIVPSVQQQIKYCFDIIVEPFDGLPQLICVRCKDILSNFATTKKNVIKKQDNLKLNLLVKKTTKVDPQHDAVSSTQTQQENIIQTNTSIRQKRLLLSSTSSDSDSALSYNVSKQNKRKNVAKAPITWESDYKKEIVCRLCDSRAETIRSMMSHYRNNHKTLRNKFSNILNRNCTVSLDKLDNKPNITGLSNMVVYSKKKIIQSSPLYCTVYSKVNNIDDNEDSLLERINSDSEEEEIRIRYNKQRKRRLLSRSSNDTVVLETHNNKAVSDEESNGQTENETNGEQCINIDTTGSESEDQSKDESSHKIALKKIIEPQLDDYKTIKGIINTCVSNYRKKKDDVPTKQPQKIESKLKHIVLSIGRKIIHNKQSINCTGLLRYMEQKNLEIQWITRTYFNKSSSNNFIRIFTKLKGPTKTTDTGWVDVYPSAKSTLASTDGLALCSELIASSSDTKNKLLNSNPVANPKQLPKKLAQTNESRSNKTIAQSNNKPSCSNIDDTEQIQSRKPNSNLAVVPKNSPFIISSDENHLCMPIITSTTSLAAFTNKEQNHKEAIAAKKTSEACTSNTPRIKVKPVSELMPQMGIGPAASNSLLLSQLSLPAKDPLNIIMPKLVPISHLESMTSQAQILQEQSLDDAPTYPQWTALPSTAQTFANENRDYLTLDTVELPNTKTKSPFNYFKNLLQLHDLVLLDPNETIPQQFVCLIKFKVVFKQETKDQPVVLCLSLFCLKNKFCLKVRDIDVHKISANWQWEILQTYTGEVVAKLLQNAQKDSRETYENTNNFICLLKSIKLNKS